MQGFYLFLLTFLVVLIVYEIFIVVPALKRKRGKDISEIKLLRNVFGVKVEKMNYKKLLQVIAFVSSLDIAIIITIAALVENFILQLLLALVLAIIIILLSYYLLSILLRRIK